MEQGKCVICNDADGSDLIPIREKGSEGINVDAKKRGDNLVTEAGQFVHIKCRQKYTSPYRIKKSLTENFNISKSISSQLFVPKTILTLLLSAYSVEK